jgi:hypothetical protein
MLHPAVFELRETLWAIVPSRLQALVELLITTDAAGIRSDDTRQMFGASAAEKWNCLAARRVLP